MGNLRLISDGPLVNRPDDLKRVNQKLRDVGNEVGRYGKLAAQGVSQLAFGDEGTIPWWMSFAPGADLTDKVMEGRQPGLLDIPGPGTLGKIAMLPIMKFGSKEILEGGARMGKSARNLEKAQNPYIERWHRTRSKNDRSIKQKGLLVGKDNPNYGKNTGDNDQLPIPAVWFGTSPTEIPVLQYYALNKPQDLSTYRVRIPKDEYYNTPRMKWDSGYRGSAKDARIVAKGESSLTGEVGRRTGNESLIDLYGKSVPPEQLERIPNWQIRKMKAHTDQMANYRNEHGSPNQSLSQVGNSIVKDEMGQWIPISERFDAFGYRPPTLKSIQYTRPDKLLKLANRQLMDNPRGVPKYGAQWLFGDLPDKFSTKVRYHKPQTLAGLTNPEAVSTGHVSRGWQSPVATDAILDDWNPIHRMFNWEEFYKSLGRGTSPYYAARRSLPLKKLVDAPEGLRLENMPKLQNSYGKISRGLEAPGGITSQLRSLAKNAALNGRTLENREGLRSILLDNEGPMSSAVLESIAKTDGTTELGNLKGVLNATEFNFNKGAIQRGTGSDWKGWADGGKTKRSLKDIYQDKLREYVDDNDWMYDDTPEGVESMLNGAYEYAKKELRELMKARIEDDNPVVKDYYDLGTSLVQ